MKQLMHLFATAALIVILQACSHSNGTIATVKQPFISDSLMKIIRIDTVRLSHAADQLKLSGEIGFDENRISKVFSNSSGQVIKVNVSFGDKVHKGQVLAVLKSADVAGNYSDRSTAMADLNIARRQLDNAKSLYQSGISSQREYEEAKESYDKAAATLGKINSLISINGKGHTSANGLYAITAPADGYIVEKKINPGSFIRSDMADNIFTISDLKDVWVWANVYESDIAKIKEGQEADVTTIAYPDKVFHGKIDKVSDLLDPVNKSLRVRLTLGNESMLLKPQMFANVMVIEDQKDERLVVPASALINDNGKSFVVVYVNNNDTQVREVHPLETVGSLTYIKDGVSPGDKVITQNQILLYDALAKK